MAEPALTPPGRITRWRLAEPIRFYLAVPFLALVVWVAGLAASGEWIAAATAALIAAALFGAVESARASVYSEPCRTSRSVVTPRCGSRAVN
jgi:hypothetical protein